MEAVTRRGEVEKFVNWCRKSRVGVDAGEVLIVDKRRRRRGW